ncbi:hypothetical protein S7335_1298 [Synechococcus sp. PCC 7335]|nr:hypothetical protein S7335_1298 [Synechococcus sp. PCC 7335]
MSLIDDIVSNTWEELVVLALHEFSKRAGYESPVESHIQNSL